MLEINVKPFQQKMALVISTPVGPVKKLSGHECLFSAEYSVSRVISKEFYIDSVVKLVFMPC